MSWSHLGDGDKLEQFTEQCIVVDCYVQQLQSNESWASWYWASLSSSSTSLWIRNSRDWWGLGGGDLSPSNSAPPGPQKRSPQLCSMKVRRYQPWWLLCLFLSMMTSECNLIGYLSSPSCSPLTCWIPTTKISLSAGLCILVTTHWRQPTRGNQ